MNACLAIQPDGITALARRFRAEAAHVSDRHKGGTLPALYRVLAGCMELCERCELDPADRAELEQLFASQPREGNRRYVEKGSDIYVFVCRYVFHDDTRANANRYSHCLRQAALQQIGSNTLADHLANNGGLNALYMRRPLDRTTVETKCLRLTESIVCPKTGRFTVTLERQPDNTYRPWSVLPASTTEPGPSQERDER
jgi:hypothetical protein